MRPLRYSINVTLDGCCDHRVMIADEDLHRHAVENLDRADALLFGRVTYEMMVAGWREVLRTGAGRPAWMMPFCQEDRWDEEVRRLGHAESCGPEFRALLQKPQKRAGSSKTIVRHIPKEKSHRL